ncbi:hypothetical protein JKP88DRAFT_249475 [Tribonema minus]|uniref:Uncharacterized protein n=1 Tax=Tribonema minus TaxID=303371 RepID=A0A835YJ85_9STRA|nr:hypothetical protein JKP88DRAFT_249475 [Tribonema minus]
MFLECAGLSAAASALAENGGGGGTGLAAITGDIAALRSRCLQLVEALRQEKGRRLRAVGEGERQAGHVRALSEHVEKLMAYLKHEAAAKARAHEQQLRLQKEVELLRARGAALERKAAAKSRAISELREGSKILEDQLRLMDAKYVELRGKLDRTRARAAREVGAAKRDCTRLRVKWTTLSREFGGCGGLRGALLDEVDPAQVMAAAAAAAAPVLPAAAAAAHGSRAAAKPAAAAAPRAAATDAAKSGAAATHQLLKPRRSQTARPLGGPRSWLSTAEEGVTSSVDGRAQSQPVLAPPVGGAGKGIAGGGGRGLRGNVHMPKGFEAKVTLGNIQMLA